jgi:hypothetical protein
MFRYIRQLVQKLKKDTKVETQHPSSHSNGNTYVVRSPYFIFSIIFLSLSCASHIKKHGIKLDDKFYIPVTKKDINLLDTQYRFYMINRDTSANSNRGSR